MPTYQYACMNPDCGNRFELVQSFSDPAADQCPVCGLPVRKVYGSVGVVFKGPGFYRTDSRAAASAASPSKSDAKSNGGSNAKTDSKSSDSKSSDSKSSDSNSASSASATSGSGASAKAAASA